MKKSSLVLASGSPRSKELLTQLGYEFSVLVLPILKSNNSQMKMRKALCQRLSLDKAQAGLA